MSNIGKSDKHTVLRHRDWRVPVTPDLLPTVLIAFVKWFDAIYLRL